MSEHHWDPLGRPPKKKLRWWLFPLAGCALLATLVVSLLVYQVARTIYLSRQEGPFRDSLQMVRNHPDVQAALGTPIAGGVRAEGDPTDSDGDGRVDFQYVISGPRKTAQVVVAARKKSGKWEYVSFRVHLERGHLDLLAPPGPEGGD